jgi:hypothetical protein
VQAYLWYGLVNEAFSANTSSVGGLRAISKKMTPAQLSEAQALVKNWNR